MVPRGGEGGVRCFRCGSRHDLRPAQKGAVNVRMNLSSQLLVGWVSLLLSLQGDSGKPRSSTR